MPDLTPGQVAVEQIQIHSGCGGDADAGYQCECGAELEPVDGDLMVAFWDHLAASIDAALS